MSHPRFGDWVTVWVVHLPERVALITASNQTVHCCNNTCFVLRILTVIRNTEKNEFYLRQNKRIFYVPFDTMYVQTFNARSICEVTLNVRRKVNAISDILNDSAIIFPLTI